MHKNFSKFFN